MNQSLMEDYVVAFYVYRMNFNITLFEGQNSPITEPVMIRIIFLYVQEYTVNKFIVSFENSAVIFWKFNALCI